MGLGSEIRDPEKTYSGSRIQGSKRHRIPDPGYRIRIRNTAAHLCPVLNPSSVTVASLKVRYIAVR
jgi:hypothetical protein